MHVHKNVYFDLSAYSCGFGNVGMLANSHIFSRGAQRPDTVAALITPSMSATPSRRRRNSRFDAYGFPTFAKRMSMKNPVAAVVELKLLSGVISQEVRIEELACT